MTQMEILLAAMPRSRLNALLCQLDAVVQVREIGGGGGEWWETIAAFNSVYIAERYAAQCAAGNSHLTYRVVGEEDR